MEDSESEAEVKKLEKKGVPNPNFWPEPPTVPPNWAPSNFKGFKEQLVRQYIQISVQRVQPQKRLTRIRIETKGVKTIGHSESLEPEAPSALRTLLTA